MDICKPGIIHVHVHDTLLVYINRINWWNGCLTVGVLLEILLCSYCTCYRRTITSIRCQFAVWTVRGWNVLGVTGCLLPKIFCASYKQYAVWAYNYSTKSDRRHGPNLRYDFYHRIIPYSSAARDQFKPVFELNKAFELYCPTANPSQLVWLGLWLGQKFRGQLRVVWTCIFLMK